MPRHYTEAGDSLSDLLSEAYDKISYLEGKVNSCPPKLKFYYLTSMNCVNS